MNVSSSRKPPTLDDSGRAWGLVSINLLVLPGLGTIIGGRKIGWLQAALALIGFGIAALALVSFIIHWFQISQPSSLNPGEATTNLMAGEFAPTLYHCLTGLAIFAVAWGWALLTSLNFLNKVKNPAVHKLVSIPHLNRRATDSVVQPEYKS